MGSYAKSWPSFEDDPGSHNVNVLQVDKSKKGVVKRSIIVTDVEMIEEYLQFGNDKSKRKTQQGFANCRVITKKRLKFYNVMIQVVATHTTRVATAERDYDRMTAEIEGTIGTLSAMASTHLPKSLDTSPSNIRLLERYMRTMPKRLHKEGFEVDNNLVKICKAIHKAKQPTGLSLPLTI